MWMFCVYKKAPVEMVGTAEQYEKHNFHCGKHVIKHEFEHELEWYRRHGRDIVDKSLREKICGMVHVLSGVK
jgi:hypothetical protein